MSFSLSRHASCVAIGLFAIIFSQHGAAAIPPYCVSNAVDLQAKLIAAATDNQDTYIELVAGGNYTLSGLLTANITDGHLLSIEGGYPAGCSSAPTAVPDGTVITGGDVAGTSISLIVNGGLVLRNVTLSHLMPTAGTDAISVTDSGVGDTTHIENVAVAANTVGASDNVLIIRPSGGLLFDDNIVHSNIGTNGAAVDVRVTYSALPIVIANNTIANNSGVGLVYSGSTQIAPSLFNNILWNNPGDDLAVLAVNTANPVLALNNTWSTCLGCANGLAQASANNISLNPQLASNYHLIDTGPTKSPALNAGLPLPTVLPPLDAAGSTRWIGSAPDQGAFESSIEDRIARVVTSVNDSGAGTLRQAIADANTSGKPANITFNIPGSCPHIVQLNGQLPSPMVSMTINGNSQNNNATINTLPPDNGTIRSNASPCITLGRATPTPFIATALQVPANASSNVHVEIYGMGFGDFLSNALDLSGGSGNWVHGDVFYIKYTPTEPVGNGVSVQIDGGVANVLGGLNPRDVNVITASTNAGVKIMGASTGYNTVIGNSIGVPLQDETAALVNAQVGVEIMSSKQNSVIGNWIVDSGSDGVLIDGASYTLVQSNLIGSSGVGILFFAPPVTAGASRTSDVIDIVSYGNGGAGVHLTDNATNNWIGTTDSSVFNVGANVISSNAMQGVWIDATALRSNQISGNTITYNSGLAIDLAAAGPTPNQPQGNSGPNVLINKPLLTSVDLTPAGTSMTVLGTILATSSSFRQISVYASHNCGDAELFLGTQFTAESAADGTLALQVNVPAPGFSPAYITATDEDGAIINDTSEISNCKLLSPSDDIFNDGFNHY